MEDYTILSRLNIWFWNSPMKIFDYPISFYEMFAANEWHAALMWEFALKWNSRPNEFGQLMDLRKHLALIVDIIVVVPSADALLSADTLAVNLSAGSKAQLHQSKKKSHRKHIYRISKRKENIFLGNFKKFGTYDENGQTEKQCTKKKFHFCKSTCSNSSTNFPT